MRLKSLVRPRGASPWLLVVMLLPALAAAQPSARSRGPGDKVMTREELRGCLKESAALKTRRDDIDREGRSLDAEQAELLKTREALTKELDAVAAEKDRVDRSDEAAVKAYNAKVESTVTSYNTKKAEVDAKIDGWNGRNQAYKSRLAEHDQSQQAWKDGCGSRRYREDDEKAIRAGK